MQDPQDPTMEQALAAIKRVMAEEKELRVAARVAEPPPADEAAEDDPPADDVLELETALVEDLDLPQPELGPPLVSEDAAEVSRQRLAELQQVAATAPPPPQAHPLEQMVRDMLRPALKDWLDQNLPGIVEEHVKREIQRITGKGL